jgi:uncharacterized protein YcbK (DUF882 family)
VSSKGALHSGLSRRAALTGAMSIAATAAVTPLCAWAAAPGALRRINIYSPRTDERLDAIYYVQGQYVPDVMQRLNNILRDVRSDEARTMDPRLIDLMAAAQRLIGYDRPFSVISGYRTQRTNDMLRRRSGGVAKKSYHVKGMAADLRMEGVSVDLLQKAGKHIGVGGVGIYTKSNFVHLDSGPVRSWGS